jgi:NodT family efflux transporter outer membrane factor (OMF) lipoprotein
MPIIPTMRHLTGRRKRHSAFFRNQSTAKVGMFCNWVEGGHMLPVYEFPGKVCQLRFRLLLPLLIFVALTLPACGCTSPLEYVTNGFKVGPNYGRPPAPVAQDWIDAADVRVRKQSDDLSQWWTVFNDPVLDRLICFAYRQNLTLREAGFRVLEARAQLGIAVGNFFPQTQDAFGGYTRTGLSRQVASSGLIKGPRFFSQWDFGFNLAWEIDFWGRFRRAIESADATLDASVEDYDDVLVTLLSDVATNYVQMRTTELRIKYLDDNVDLQRKTVKVIEGRRDVGVAKELDVDQARSILAQTQAQIPQLEITLRQTTNQLCILLGIPPEELRAKLGPAGIPNAPTDVAVGIPADLLRRRPDVRRQERLAAAQSAQIGVAEADFYPHISILGTIGYSASEFNHLFRSSAFNGTVGPSFEWNILNYGRILNNVRFQDAKFQELVALYQDTVLKAGQEAENGLVTFLKGQEFAKLQGESVDYANKAVKVVLAQYEIGTVDITQLIQIELNLVVQQDTLALAQGQIPAGLIQVYKALGGGWQIRLNGCDPNIIPKDSMSQGRPNNLPTPRPLPGINPNAGTDKLLPVATDPGLPPMRAQIGAPVAH